MTVTLILIHLFYLVNSNNQINHSMKKSVIALIKYLGFRTNFDKQNPNSNERE